MLQYIKNLFGWGKTAEAVVEKADHALTPDTSYKHYDVKSQEWSTRETPKMPPLQPTAAPSAEGLSGPKVVRGVLSEGARAALQKRTPEQKREQYRQTYTPPPRSSYSAYRSSYSSPDYRRSDSSSNDDQTSAIITGMMVNEMLHSHHTSAPEPAPGYSYGTSASTDYSTPSYSSSSCTSDDSSRSSYSSSDYSSSSSYDSSSSSSYDSGSSCSSDW